MGLAIFVFVCVFFFFFLVFVGFMGLAILVCGFHCWVSLGGFV